MPTFISSNSHGPWTLDLDLLDSVEHKLLLSCRTTSLFFQFLLTDWDELSQLGALLNSIRNDVRKPLLNRTALGIYVGAHDDVAFIQFSYDDLGPDPKFIIETRFPLVDLSFLSKAVIRLANCGNQ
jgi:hypothetical protein